MPTVSYRESMKRSQHAIIIGGGIAGPAVSLFPRRAGIDSQIFEAYPEPTTIGGGTTALVVNCDWPTLGRARSIALRTKASSFSCSAENLSV